MPQQWRPRPPHHTTPTPHLHHTSTTPKHHDHTTAATRLPRQAAVSGCCDRPDTRPALSPLLVLSSRASPPLPSGCALPGGGAHAAGGFCGSPRFHPVHGSCVRSLPPSIYIELGCLRPFSYSSGDTLAVSLKTALADGTEMCLRFVMTSGGPHTPRVTS